MTGSFRAAVAAILTAIVPLGYFGTAAALDLGTGQLPLHYDPGASFGLAPDGEIRIEGRVEAAANVILVVRIDDIRSGTYATRFNEERELPPGPFHWTIPATGLRTADGRFLDSTALRRAFVFVGKGEGRVSLTRWETGPAPQLPHSVKGYALGMTSAALPSGFERIAPGDPRISSGRVFAVARPAPDPLVANGIRGIERLTLVAPPGRVHVTLWTEDPGEWELMPHALARRYRVNGVTLVDETMTPRQWIKSRYLAGATEEHSTQDDAWTAYGRRRGGRLGADVEVDAGGQLTIELAGDSASALFLSAVIVEPAGSNAGVDSVEAQRADWYRSRWPIVPATPSEPDSVVILPIVGEPFNAASVRATAAIGSSARLSIEVRATEPVDDPRVSLKLVNAGAITGRAWAGLWRLERRTAGATVLTLADDMLTGDLNLPLGPQRSRTFELWFDVPEGAVAGVHFAQLVIVAPSRTFEIPLEIEVLPVQLPAAEKPAGFYLDEAPHLTWFAELHEARGNQIKCDLDVMDAFGLHGGAPALATPDETGPAFLQDMRLATAAHVSAPWLAYAPAKRLRDQLGTNLSAKAIAQAENALRAAQLVPPVWAVADEPSNPSGGQTQLLQWLADLRRLAPEARLAAQLNSPSDRSLLGLFDVVLVNHGFGLDLDILREAATGRELWIYNADRPRLASGLWLWRSPARRYIQWHARMPTAAPFDPTDGREGDVFALFPTPEDCPAIPTIHRDLLDMADGVLDQRWLLWLARQHTPEAAALLQTLNASPTTWSNEASMQPQRLKRLRESIIKVARLIKERN